MAPATPSDTERESRAAAMWPADREERARLWNAAMARGEARFWREAGRPELAERTR